MTKEDIARLPRQTLVALSYHAIMCFLTRGEPAATGHWKAIRAIAKPIVRARVK